MQMITIMPRRPLTRSALIFGPQLPGASNSKAAASKKINRKRA
jgi:hypothetical protein